jgi:hypothetical protein
MYPAYPDSGVGFRLSRSGWLMVLVGMVLLLRRVFHLSGEGKRVLATPQLVRTIDTSVGGNSEC